MKESVAIAKEANTKKESSPTRSDNSIQRLRNEPKRQLGSLRAVIGNIRRNGGTPSVESIATELSVMPTSDRAPVLLALQQTHGNRYVQRVVTGIQAKLKIGQPGDKYEQEADRVAEQVMQMPEPQVQRQAEEEEEEEEPIQTELNGSIQRQPEEEEDEELVTPKVQEKLTMGSPGDVYEQEADRVAEQITGMSEHQVSKQTADSSAQSSTVSPIVYEVLSSHGQPLDPSTRAFFEPRLGYGFSRVRLHTDPHAAESARAVSALAYTVGPNIVFGTGQYAPTTESGKKLIAHELTHVLQQRATFSSRRPQVTANRTAGIEQYVPTATVQKESRSSIICEDEARTVPYTYLVNFRESFRMPFFCLRNGPNLRIITSLRLNPAPSETQSFRLDLHRGSEHARIYPVIGSHIIPIDGSDHTINFPGIGRDHYHLFIHSINPSIPANSSRRLHGNVLLEWY